MTVKYNFDKEELEILNIALKCLSFNPNNVFEEILSQVIISNASNKDEITELSNEEIRNEIIRIRSIVKTLLKNLMYEQQK